MKCKIDKFYQRGSGEKLWNLYLSCPNNPERYWADRDFKTKKEAINFAKNKGYSIQNGGI